MRTLLEARTPGLLTYGLTPPKRSTAPDKRRATAEKQVARVAGLGVDALVIYDLQDESARTDVARPFPYAESSDPTEYAYVDLAALRLPKIVYRGVAELSAPALRESLRSIQGEGGLSVFVGAASKSVESKTRLPDAYALAKSEFSELPVGGVLIAERHGAESREDQRVLRKLEQGCRFFITQTVYSAGRSKDVLSDLYYECRARELDVPPILITLSPCGSLKTLEFMHWLGISVPRWLENELRHSSDILRTSVEHSLLVLEELVDFAKEKGLPLGCNVESVSLGKAEIDASVELTERASQLLGRR
jgi:hypothetical protein